MRCTGWAKLHWWLFCSEKRSEIWRLPVRKSEFTVLGYGVAFVFVSGRTQTTSTAIVCASRTLASHSASTKCSEISSWKKVRYGSHCRCNSVLITGYLKCEETAVSFDKTKKPDSLPSLSPPSSNAATASGLLLLPVAAAAAMLLQGRWGRSPSHPLPKSPTKAPRKILFGCDWCDKWHRALEFAHCTGTGIWTQHRCWRGSVLLLKHHMVHLIILCRLSMKTITKLLLAWLLNSNWIILILMSRFHRRNILNYWW